MIGIYEIYCIDSNKSYIGQSTNMEARLKQHENLLKQGLHPNKDLQEDWNEYGAESFVFHELKETNLNELNEKEDYYIKKFNSIDEGYNQISAPVKGSYKSIPIHFNPKVQMDNELFQWIKYNGYNENWIKGILLEVKRNNLVHVNLVQSITEQILNDKKV